MKKTVKRKSVAKKVIARKKVTKNFNKNWIILVVLLILSLFLTVYIVQKQTALNQEAAATNITFSGLSVSGNKLVNQQGQQVVLHGADRSGAEYSCVGGSGVFDGPSDAASTQAMRTWNIDVVRVPLNEDCWLGINGVKTGGTVYQQAIQNYVTVLNQQGMYVILDLHWNAPGATKATGQTNMADSDHSPAFWTGVANAFKGNTTVIFDLYNEPHDISWSCWKDSSSGSCGTVAGMQQLINAVRSTGAKNVVMAGGLGWSSDLSGWLANKPTDPANNLAASWHMYGNSGCEGSGMCWNTSLMTNVINQVPVIVGEFGESSDGSVCGTNIVNAFMTWLDQHQTSYVAWTWDTWGGGCGALTLINDYAGTPKSPNGVAIKAHYLTLGTTVIGPLTTGVPTVSGTQVTSAPTPTPIIPTFNCLGGCPTGPQNPTVIPVVSQPAVTQPVVTQPLISQNPISLAPTISSSPQPCNANQSMRNQSNNSLVTLLLQLLQILLRLISQLLGGMGTPPTTTPC